MNNGMFNYWITAWERVDNDPESDLIALLIRDPEIVKWFADNDSVYPDVTWEFEGETQCIIQIPEKVYLQFLLTR